jgi:hypothetical protein
MATAEGIKTLTAQAGGAVPIYRFVQLQSDGKYDVTGSADIRADGVSAEAAAADLDIFAMAELQGKMKVEASAAISVGDLVAATTAGKAKTAASAGAATFVCGVARTAAAADGDIIEVQLHLFKNNAS